MPITATMPRRSLESSTRMPASLRLSSSTSFGHLRRAPATPSDDSARASATPTASETGQPLDAAVKAPQDGEGQARRGRRLPESAPAAAAGRLPVDTSTLPGTGTSRCALEQRVARRGLSASASTSKRGAKAPSSGFSRRDDQCSGHGRIIAQNGAGTGKRQRPVFRPLAPFAHESVRSVPKPGSSKQAAYLSSAPITCTAPSRGLPPWSSSSCPPSCRRHRAARLRPGAVAHRSGHQALQLATMLLTLLDAFFASAA